MILCWVMYYSLIFLNLVGLIAFYKPYRKTYSPLVVNPAPLYAIHCLIIVVCSIYFYKFFQKKFNQKKTEEPVDKETLSAKKQLNISYLILFLQFALVALLIFLFDGYEVLTGKVYRGEWRSSFGLLGPVVALVTKFLIPANFILFSLIYFRVNNTISRLHLNILYILISIFTVLGGLSLGGKTTAIYVILGGLFIAFNRVKISYKEILLYLLTVVNIYILSTHYFDASNESNWQATLDYGISRVLYIQSEPIGLIYQKVDWNSKKLIYMPYYKTLLGFLGNHTLANIYSVDKDSFTLLQYNFSKLTTFLSYPRAVDQILSDQYNVTAGIFTEGVMAFGKYGFYIFSCLNALIAAYMFYLLSKANKTYSDYKRTTMVLVYFLSAFIPWTNSGGITILFHVVTIFSMVCLHIYLVILEKISNKLGV